METVEDHFMRRGLQMAVDGTDPDDLFDILAAEVKAKKTSAAAAAGFWTDAGGYSPTIGIIGTVFGLIHVLENLSEPDKLGHLIAAAFLATLWGVLSANVMFLPWAKRIKTVGAAEAARMELIIDGVLAIQAGANPRVVADQAPLQDGVPGAGGRRQGSRMSSGGGGGRRRRPRGGARGAREPRALAGQLRGHDDAADGAVHRDVRDQPGGRAASSPR